MRYTDISISRVKDPPSELFSNTDKSLEDTRRELIMYNQFSFHEQDNMMTLKMRGCCPR